MKWLILLLALVPGLASAATVTVTWRMPTTYEDGSPLALTSIKDTVVERGSCNADGSFGTPSSSKVVAAPATSTGIVIDATPVCLRAKVRLVDGQESKWSNTKKVVGPSAPIIL